jgi:cytochrome c oxidase cbb3-type subunit 3
MATPDVERDKLFDHEYDGIREYDNPMPGWWVWLFVGSVLFCLPYTMWYHFGKGPSIHEKLDAEIAAYGQQLMEQYGDLEATAGNITSMMDNEPAMAAMDSLFKGRCAACHQANGSGSTGPNLTDDYFINVNEITDIADILRDGVVERGMPAWGEQLTPTQIVLLSAYVANMRGQNLPGKAPQGKEIAPWPDAPAEGDADGEGDTEAAEDDDQVAMEDSREAGAQ